MRKNQVSVAVAGVGLFVLVGVTAVLAQDPAVVNAKTVQVKLENERVRVLEAVLQPGEKEQLHSHPDCVIDVVSGGKSRSHSAEGKTTETELVTGSTIYRAAVTHWAENVGATPLRLIIVELKPLR